MTKEQLEIREAEERRRQEELQAYNEQNYIQWLRDIKPKWTETQVLESAGKHFGKNFLPEVEEEVEKQPKYVDESLTVKELNSIIEFKEIDVDLKLNKVDKIEAINKILIGE